MAYVDAEGTVQTKTVNVEGFSDNTLRNVIIAHAVWEVLQIRRLDAVCVEGYAFGMPVKGASSRMTQIAEMTGLTKHLVLSDDIPIIVVPPSTLKKFITGKGNASKGEVTKFLKQEWDKAFTDFDKADAFSAMMYGRAVLGSDYPKGPKDSLAKSRADTLRSSVTIQPEEIVKSISIRFE